MDKARQKCIILGGGGHAKVLIDAIQAGGQTDLIGILDRDPALWGKEILGVTVLGSDEDLEKYTGRADAFVVGIGSVGDPSIRIKLFEMGQAAGFEPLTVIHPRAIVSPHTFIGRGSMLYAGCIINPGARIGENVIINTGAVVEHDCVIGDHAHIATGARLAGTVTIGQGAHIGAGAVVIQNMEVGANALVGAGAVVTKMVGAGEKVVGNPAHVLRNEANRNKIAAGLE